MDKLPADEQAAIAKSSSDRLRQTLLSAGEVEATVSTMDRGALKEAAAKQKLQVPAEPSSLERELALRRLEMEFELEVKKMEMQKESEKCRVRQYEVHCYFFWRLRKLLTFIVMESRILAVWFGAAIVTV